LHICFLSDPVFAFFERPNKQNYRSKRKKKKRKRKKEEEKREKKEEVNLMYFGNAKVIHQLIHV